MSRPMTPCPKETNYRNPKLLALAKECPCCMSCGADNVGQVVAAHSNSQRHGKGTGIKAHDIPAYVCDQCHALIDGRTNNVYNKNLLFADAMFHSLLWLLQSGHLEVKP